MPIEIRELVIRATIDKKKSSDGNYVLNQIENEKLKREILAYCIHNIQKPIDKKLNNLINR